MTTLTADVTTSGPFFTKDPGKTIGQNIERLMQRVAEAGAEEARRGFAAGSGSRFRLRWHGARGARVADYVVGRVFARPSKGGRRWLAHGVVQVYNEGLSAEQSRSLMAAGSLLEGRTNTMRTTTRKMAAMLRKVDLTEGLGG